MHYTVESSNSNGLITSAIKLAIKIKTNKVLQHNKQHFVVDLATTKMLMRAATVVHRRPLRSMIAVAAQDSAAEHCDGSRLRG